MAFYLWTCVGIAIGIVHLMLPGIRRVGPASAIGLGVLGAWGGAMGLSTLVQGGWIFFGPIALAGAIVGAAGAVAGIDVVADRLRDESRDDGGETLAEERARVHA